MQTPGPANDVTDIPGVRIGHHHRDGDGWGTGVTVLLPPPGTVGSVDVRGGGPATRETDALAPATMVQTVDAICLSGGSAHGLDAAAGVMAFCEAAGRGFRVGPADEHIVPIVAAASLFDLGVIGAFGNRPGPEFGRIAAENAAAGLAEEPDATMSGSPPATGAGEGTGRIPQGSVGAGAGATAGILKGGIGSASTVLADGVRVAALVAVNAAGSPVDPATGLLWGARHGLTGEFDELRHPDPVDLAAYTERLGAAVAARDALLNTTLAVIVTDAALTKSECARLAAAGHDGMARALDPIHGYVDGDIVFGLATGAVPVGPPDAPLRPEGARLVELGNLLAAATDTVTRAIVHATLAATAAGPFPAYRDLFPSVFEPAS